MTDQELEEEYHWFKDSGELKREWKGYLEAEKQWKEDNYND